MASQILHRSIYIPLEGHHFICLNNDSIYNLVSHESPLSALHNGETGILHAHGQNTANNRSDIGSVHIKGLLVFTEPGELQWYEAEERSLRLD